MLIGSWSVINNEITFIKDVIDHHLTWVDAMYILDTGSVDGTLEYIKERALTDPRIILEEYHTKYVPRYELDWLDIENPFPEVEIRNYAISRAELLLNPRWLIQIDGDEIFTSDTKDIILANDEFSCIGHHTINPVCKLEFHSIENRRGIKLYDPHVRIWKSGNNIGYYVNKAFKGKQIHCIPGVLGSGKHLFIHPGTKFIDIPFFFHLHWMYGPKVEGFYKTRGTMDKEGIIATQDKNEFSDKLPKLFWDKREAWINEK